MILHLIRNRQLKIPLQHVPLTAFVLISDDGNVWKALDHVITAKEIKGMSLATFDLAVVGEKHDTTFHAIEVYCLRHLTQAQREALKTVVFTSQSLTIAWLARTLEVPRESAKLLLNKFVACGAYRKYYSYWRKTDAFNEWVAR